MRHKTKKLNDFFLDELFKRVVLCEAPDMKAEDIDTMVNKLTQLEEYRLFLLGGLHNNAERKEREYP